MKLTLKEQEMLTAFIDEGRDVNGAECAQDLHDDNMTWMSATDLEDVLGWNKQSIGGVMASLSNKGLICDSGESARGAADTDWFATEIGIDLGWKFL